MPNQFQESQQRHYSESDFVSGGNLNLDPQFKDVDVKLEHKYHHFDQMTQYLRQTTARYPSLTALYSIGKSVKGKKLFCIIKLAHRGHTQM